MFLMTKRKKSSKEKVITDPNATAGIVSYLVEQAGKVEMRTIGAEVEAITKGSKEPIDIDEALETVTNKYLKDFEILAYMILNNLDISKKNSYPNYLQDFKIAFEGIDSIFSKESYYETDFTSKSLYNGEVTDIPYFAIQYVNKILNKKAFKPLYDAFIIERSNDFCLVYNLPENFNDLIAYIKRALYEIERFMEGKTESIKYYNLPAAFKKFNSARFLFENNPRKCISLLDKFYGIIQTFSYEIESGDFPNEEIQEDEIFSKISDDIYSLEKNMPDFFTKEEIEELTPETLSVLEMFEEEEKEQEKEKPTSQIITPDTFSSIISEENQTFILTMLEELSITLNGKSILSVKKKSAIRGVVEALKENHILPERGIDFLCKIIGTAISLEISSKLESTYTSKTFKKSANKYIEQNYKK